MINKLKNQVKYCGIRSESARNVEHLCHFERFYEDLKGLWGFLRDSFGILDHFKGYLKILRDFKGILRVLRDSLGFFQDSLSFQVIFEVILSEFFVIWGVYY